LRTTGPNTFIGQTESISDRGTEGLVHLEDELIKQTSGRLIPISAVAAGDLSGLFAWANGR